jgi:anaerobic selenocysteine-containing dehydrogenase
MNSQLKEKKLSQDINETKELASVCPLDCPDTCSLRVSVKNGKVLKVRGSKVNPFTQGSICKKVAKYYPDFVHSEHRLTHPLQRSGPKGSGQYRKISWEKAIELVHNEFTAVIKAHGAQCILPLNYAGPHGKLAGGSMDKRFFSRLGASDLNRSPLCGGVRSLSYSSMFGSAQGMSGQQMEFSDLIVVWGSNITVSNLHLTRCINAAKKKGAKLIVIDPHKTQIAKQADLYLQITPGGDVLLALKLMATLKQKGVLNLAKVRGKVFGLDEYLEHLDQYLDVDLTNNCKIGSEQFALLVELCANSKRLSLSIGVGLERTRNGGAAIVAAQALPVLLGDLGEIGQGIVGSFSTVFKGRSELQNKADRAGADSRRVFNIVDIANHMLDKSLDVPIMAAFIYNHNPIATHPDQNKMRKALSRDDLFIVGCDVQMNDSMLFADVILPAATHFEHQDVFSAYGHGYLQRADAVIPRVGESLQNTEIFRRLAAKFDFKDKCFTESDDELVSQAFDLNISDDGVESAADILPNQALAMQKTDRIWLSDKELSTPSGLIEMYSEALKRDYQCALPKFQSIEKSAEFILISPASANRINATFGGSTHSASEFLEINPEDAAKHALEDRQSVTIGNKLGEVQLIVKITQDVAQGVLCCDKGAWCNSSETGQTINALISNKSKTDIGDGAAYYDTFVDIRK